MPDGERIIFSADWNGSGTELYTIHLETNEIRDTKIKNAQIFSISAAGEILVALNPKVEGYFSRATMAKMSVINGEPGELLKDIIWADRHPSKTISSSISNEKRLAVVRDGNGKTHLEFPFGNVIYTTGGWLCSPRFSPDGKNIAFIEHPLWGDDRGFVVCLDLENKANAPKRLTKDVRISIQGLAWSNDEIWFTASLQQGNARVINAVDLNGEERPIYRATGRLTLHDVSKDGKVLITDEKMRVQVAVRHENDENERDTIVARLDSAERFDRRRQNSAF